MKENYLLIEIPNRNCKGIAYQTDLALKKITSPKDIKDKTFKFRLKLRIDGQLVKKFIHLQMILNMILF